VDQGAENGIQPAARLRSCHFHLPNFCVLGNSDASNFSHDGGFICILAHPPPPLVYNFFWLFECGVRKAFYLQGGIYEQILQGRGPLVCAIFLQEDPQARNRRRVIDILHTKSDKF
jgi:hypothetical protein